LSVCNHGWLAASLAVTACNLQPVVAHPPEHPTTPTVSLESLEHDLHRHQVAGDGVEVFATLWDRSMVDARPLPEDAADPSALEESQRWITSFLERTSFTVAIEIADRGPFLVEGDASLLELSNWRFTLDRGSEVGLEPVAVDLIGVDRFPSASGTPHFRLLAQVHFAGSVHERAKQTAEHLDLRLRVHPEAAFASLGSLPKRYALGTWAQEHGISLYWKVQPA